MRVLFSIILAGFILVPVAFAQTPPDRVGEHLSSLRRLEQPPEGGELNFESPPPAPAIYADQLAGAEVFGADGEDIGRIADVVYSEDGNVEAAVVTVDGFWGFGGYDVKIPLTELTVSPPIGPRGVFAVRLPLTREQVRAMPAYNRSD